MTDDVTAEVDDAEDVECEAGCIFSAGHDGPCLDDDDVAEARLQARDYDAWAAL